MGWTPASSESGELGRDLITDCRTRRQIGRDTLTIHGDRGTSMTSKPVSQLLIDLGVVRSHSHPHVSNINPNSEAAFKTLKYCPAFPRPVRLPRRQEGAMRGVLQLRQPRPPAQRHRAAYPRLGALRHRP